MTQSPPAESAESLKLPDVLPVLPLEDTVIFPYVIVPLSLGSERSVLAVDHALAGSRLVMLVAEQPKAKSHKEDGRIREDDDEPDPSKLFEIGTVGMVMRMLKLPDGRMRILVQGLMRARILHLSRSDPFFQARIEGLDAEDEEDPVNSEDPDDARSMTEEALMRNVREGLEQAVHQGRNLSPEVMVVAANVDDPGRLADLVASNLELKLEDAQGLLETADPTARLRSVGEHLQRELELLDMQHQISTQAQDEIDKSQREYFLRQQLKAIQKELGETDDLAEEIAAYRKAAKKRKLSKEALEELDKQIVRLERSHPDSAETTVIRTYLDWLTGLPWTKVSDDNLDLGNARRILDEDHYDLDEIKERILELLAVRKLKDDSKGPILCFVGPPGVGKTSLGRSIARALGRELTRLSLGGVRDEAEIRGHRRTYVGALPGRILQNLQRAGTNNPVFMLDEIDKIGSDYRGDPSSALLEVLDPEQNHSFHDHYLGVPYDLSQILFITTANLLDPIQPAFLDRMEVIRLSGYTEEEKLTIARRHLIPKQLEENGLKPTHLRITDAGLRKLLRGYTREAGLRNFEREIASVCRKIAVKIALRPDSASHPDVAQSADAKQSKAGKKAKSAKAKSAKGKKTRVSGETPTATPRPVVVGPREVERFLGPEKHFSEELLDRDRVGVATGLAWTAAGGDILLIEVVAVPGKGKLLLTGQLGDVMKESAQAALSYARAFATARGENTSFFSENDIHIHAPAGSIPKDGPSAGITIATAVLSLLTGIPVDRRVAMTGEITLRGDILPIGGVKEKALAARAAGIRTVILPRHNARDLVKLPRSLRRELEIVCLDHLDDVLNQALVRELPALLPTKKVSRRTAAK